MYKVISNTPDERSSITYPWIWWDDAFTNDELKKIEDTCSHEKMEKATIFGEEDINEIEKIRKTRIHFFKKDQATEWIFNKLNTTITIINESYYNYNLNGYKTFQYSEYHAEENGKYDWHMDTLHGFHEKYSKDLTRKLSVVMCLSDPEKDFEGGEFQINMGNQDFPQTILMKKGRIIVFPSYLIHRVKPVTKGIRKSIVIWVVGPKFI